MLKALRLFTLLCAGVCLSIILKDPMVVATVLFIGLFLKWEEL